MCECVCQQRQSQVCFHPISCGGAVVQRCSRAGRSLRFPQNNVTRRGIPVRPGTGRGEGRAGVRLGDVTEIWLWLPPGNLPPTDSRGGGLTCPASCRLPNSSDVFTSAHKRLNSWLLSHFPLQNKVEQILGFTFCSTTDQNSHLSVVVFLKPFTNLSSEPDCTLSRKFYGYSNMSGKLLVT